METNSLLAIPHNWQNTITMKHKREIFAFWFSISFILNGYASGIPGLSLGSVVFVIIVFLSVKRIHILKTHWYTLIFAFFAIGVSMVGFILNGTPYFTPRAMFLNIAKLMLWAMMASVISERYYVFEINYKCLKKLAYVMLVYLVFQNIAFYAFHKYLPNIFDFFLLKPYDIGYADAADYLTASPIIRPAGFLSESAFLGNYLLCVLAMAFEDLYHKKSGKMRDILIISAGIILSSSTSAAVCMPVLWIIYWKKLRKIVKQKVLILCIAAILLLAILFWAVPSLWGSNFVYSFRYMFDKLSRMSQNTRIGKSFSYLDHAPRSVILFGVGYGNYITYLQTLYGITGDIYVNAVVGIVMQIGVVGLLGFGILCLKLIYEGVRYKNCMVISLMFIYLIKGFSSGIFFSTYGILFMFLINGEINTYRKAGYLV